LSPWLDSQSRRRSDAVDDNVEILSGVTAGERVAVDPQAAALER